MIFLQHFFYSEQHCFLLEQTVLNVLQTFQTDWGYSSTQYCLFIQKSCSIGYPLFCHLSCKSVLSQLSSLTIIYFIPGVKSCSPTFLVAISANCRPPSHQSIFFILHFSSFLTKIHSTCSVSFVFGILTIISHTHNIPNVQDNQRIFLCNYVWTLVQKFMHWHP